jgi:hypothetical protein
VSSRLAVAWLLLLPLLWLWPCVVGGRTFVPYDPAEFPPASLLVDEARWQSMQATANHDVTEVPPWFLPELELARDELRAGRLPTWNPHARGGAPLHAHGLLGLCYPPNWLALLADDPAARLVLLAWVSLALAGVGAFGLLRAHGLGIGAATFGGMAFELGAPMAANAHFWMRLASHAWLPLLCLAITCLARAPSWRTWSLPAMAVAFAMPWLAGFPPFATTTTLVGGGFAAWAIAARWRAEGSRAALALTLRFGAAALLGAMLAAPQLLPSLLFFPHSARTPDPDLAHIATTRFDTYGLLGYLLPDAFGHPLASAVLPYGQSPLCYLLIDRFDAAGKAVEPNFNYTEYSVFFGSFALLLAGFGAVAGRGHRRALPLVVLAVCVGLALMLPGVAWLYHLPVVKNVWPMRWLVPASLPLAWLAAIGWQRLVDGAPRGGRVLAGVALALAALLPFVASRPAAWHAADPTWPAAPIAERYRVPLQGAVEHFCGSPPAIDRFARAGEQAEAAGRRAALWFGIAGLCLLAHALLRRRPQVSIWPLRLAAVATAVELALHGAPLLHGIDRATPTDTAVHAFLREQAVARAAEGGFAIARASRAEALQTQLPPGQLLVPGIRDLHFYTHFDGRSLAPLQRLLGASLGARHAAKGYLTTALPERRPMPGETLPADEPPPVAAPLQHPLLDLLGVRYLLTTDELTAAGPRVGPDLRGPRGALFVHERTTALPRAFAVPRLTVLADDEAVLQALLAVDLQPAQQAFATAADVDAGGITAAGGDGAPTPAAAREVRFVADRRSEIELAVAAGSEPWLVLTDTWLPGWSATVDDAPAQLVRTNHSQRLLRLPAAACRVRFTYAAPGLAVGLLLAGLAAASLLGIAFVVVRRR